MLKLIFFAIVLFVTFFSCNNSSLYQNNTNQKFERKSDESAVININYTSIQDSSFLDLSLWNANKNIKNYVYDAKLRSSKGFFEKYIFTAKSLKSIEHFGVKVAFMTLNDDSTIYGNNEDIYLKAIKNDIINICTKVLNFKGITNDISEVFKNKTFHTFNQSTHELVIDIDDTRQFNEITIVASRIPFSFSSNIIEFTFYGQR